MAVLFSAARGPVTSIVNAHSDATPTCINLTTVLGSGSAIGKAYLSGALTAATLATVINVSGRGSLNFAAVRTADATARTIRIKVTIDGTAVFDPGMSAAVSASNNGLIAVGATVSTSGAVFQPIEFTSSCLVQIASSLTETDKLIATLNYEVWSS